MTRVAIVFHSGGGHTKIMADAVRAGAAAVDGVEVSQCAIEGKQIVEGKWQDPGLLDELDGADAILLGCPTYMGSVSAEMKAFLDATLDRWYGRKWSDKVASGFTVSSTPSGDKLNTLVTLSVFAMQFGMIWVGQEQTPMNDRGINRLSFYAGAAGQAEYGKGEVALHAGDAETGSALGERVARIAHALRLGREAAPAEIS